MNGYRQLERQLRESVKQRARRRGVLAWPLPGRRLAVALVPLALVGGVATAATQLRHGAGSEKKAHELVAEAIKLTRKDPACGLSARHATAIVDEPPPAEIVAALPALAAAPPAPSSVLAYVRKRSGGAVLGRTLRLVPVAGHRRLLVFVAHGLGPFTVVDPQGCLRARQARLAVLVPDARDPVRRAAEHDLSEQRDTNATLLALNVLLVPPGRTMPSAGTAIPLTPGQPLPTGIVMSLGRTYTGIAKPGAVSVTVRTEHGRQLRKVAVRDGFFAFSLPADTGPVVYAQHAADGRVLSSTRLRR